MKTNYLSLILILAIILLLVSCSKTESDVNDDIANIVDNNQPSVSVEVVDGVIDDTKVEDIKESIQIKKADLSPNDGHTGTIAKVKLRFCYECVDIMKGSYKDVDFDFEDDSVDIKTNPHDGERPSGKMIEFDSEEAGDIVNSLTKKHGIKLKDYERSECKGTEPGDLTIVYKTTRRILVEEDLCPSADTAINEFYKDFFDKVYRKYYPKEVELGIAFADSTWSGPAIDRTADNYADNPYAGRN